MAGLAFAWGLGISAAAGAVSGTVVFPVIGTIYGLLYGACFGLLPTLVGMVLVVVTVWPYWPIRDPGAVHRSLRTMLLLYGVGVQAAVYPFLRGAVYGPDDADSVVAPTLAVAPVLAIMLPAAATSLARTYARAATTAGPALTPTVLPERLVIPPAVLPTAGLASAAADPSVAPAESAITAMGPDVPIAELPGSLGPARQWTVRVIRWVLMAGLIALPPAAALTLI